MTLEEEIAVLDRLKASPPYSMEDAQRRLAWVWLYGETAKSARREREMYLKSYGVQEWDGTGPIPMVSVTPERPKKGAP